MTHKEHEAVSMIHVSDDDLAVATSHRLQRMVSSNYKRFLIFHVDMLSCHW